MPTLSPSTEACEAIRDRINSGTDYALEVRATVVDELTEDLQDLRQLRAESTADGSITVGVYSFGAVATKIGAGAFGVNKT